VAIIAIPPATLNNPTATPAGAPQEVCRIRPMMTTMPSTAATAAPTRSQAGSPELGTDPSAIRVLSVSRTTAPHLTNLMSSDPFCVRV